jgi:hypothetical protein
LKNALKFTSFIALSVIVWEGKCALAADEQKTFLACPVVRDTKTVPCWLAEYNGKTYYLGIQADQAAAFQPPELEHKVLVEGVADPNQRICGGIVLKPIKISIIPDIDLTCQTVLPAVDEYQVPFAPRGPGPNNPSYRLQAPPPPPEFKPPFTQREFTIYFDFDAERAGRSTRIITEAMAYAKAAQAKHVEVTGYRAAVRLADGSDLVEYPWIAEHRAKVMSQTLQELGIPAAGLATTWNDKPEVGTGMDAYTKRRLTIVVTP